MFINCKLFIKELNYILVLVKYSISNQQKAPLLIILINSTISESNNNEEPTWKFPD